jgi:hypothetical protein
MSTKNEEATLFESGEEILTSGNKALWHFEKKQATGP